ncbi:quinohemoprotein amine dehydrogenase subunit beta [Sulfitobacter sp. D35]|uniref:quinohemoprotein amine dehydrogenase subunit beta n=1 Tax=Sulfitobacter sp. D35 TaxID=3083252 RepID=UPI00296EC1A6|nr:quinohemoprotein amine dehydrogenase subunit beta [Sulfitobacter sp. D35]MDW4497373.1 quinohemoprotein amine dehydrogenase subunit beta [Sulfitobacter sp. D35]
MRQLSILAAVLLAAAPAGAKDLLVTIAKPGNLYVFDAAARELVKDCPLEVEMSPAVIQMSPDGTVAYALVNRWEDVIGVNIETCERVFYAAQSEADIKRRSIASLAVSPDGAEVYTIRNPVKHHSDRYEVMEPEFAVFDTSSGTEAQPVRTYPAPRRSTVMQTGDDGTVYVGGHDIYAIDPASGAVSVKIPNASWEREKYSPPDVLAFWPVGKQNDEFMLMYTAAVFADDAMTEIADFVWGFSSVDLESGETTLQDFASLEVLMFSGVRDPNAENLLYGVYTQLSKHDVETRELIKRVDLPHTYYVINISSDGRELYVGGTNDDIGVYDAETLERIGEMLVPSGGDMGTATMQIVQAE